ncbi:MAG: BACON domain-containing protein [Bacteroidales bacterium]|jgi:hypothetical protein|nr:BACON domain-containing protein [Bacteroidales bacterium]
MKTNFKQALAILAVVFGGTACDDKAENQLESQIEISTASMTFEHEGGDLPLDVSSNADWTIDKSGCVWVTVNTLAGTGDQTLTVTASRNAGAHRTGKLVLLAGDKSKEVSITQYSAVLSFGEPSVSGVLKSNLSIDEETCLVIPYSGGIGNETFTVSVVTSAAGINAVSDFVVTLTTPAGEIFVPLSGVPATAGEVTFSITTNYANPTTGTILTIPALQATIEIGATLVVGELSLSDNLTYTKSVGNSLILSLPYEDALGVENFTLSVAVSGVAAPGITTDATVDVAISQPGNGTIEIPVSGIPYKAGQVTFTVTGDNAAKTFTLDAAEINKSVNATVADDGKRYYNGAFVISGVMGDPRGTDGTVAGAAATFFNPDMNNLKQHAGPCEYMQFLALEEINFSQTPYCVIVCKMTDPNGPTADGWTEGGGKTFKFNLTEGTVSKGEFFYVGGAAKTLSGYRDDAASKPADWPHVSVGIMSIRDSKWIRALTYANNPFTFDDGIGSRTTDMFYNYTASALRFNGIAAFKGTVVDKNTVPMDALFFGTNNSFAYNADMPSSYLTVPLNDLYSPVEGHYGQGTNTVLLTSVYTSGAADHGEFMKFGGRLGIDGNNNKVWLQTRDITCISLGDPGMYIGSPNNTTLAENKYDPAKENEPNPHFPGDDRYTKRLATIADIETFGDGITAIVDQP